MFQNSGRLKWQCIAVKKTLSVVTSLTGKVFRLSRYDKDLWGMISQGEKAFWWELFFVSKIGNHKS